MNNKKLGNNFENELADLLAESGYWAHVVAPSKDGSQPCDIIASRDGVCILIDCKVVTGQRFEFKRLEENQILASESLEGSGSSEYWLALKMKSGKIFFINLIWLKKSLVYTSKKSLNEIDIQSMGMCLEAFSLRHSAIKGA